MLVGVDQPVDVAEDTTTPSDQAGLGPTATETGPWAAPAPAEAVAGADRRSDVDLAQARAWAAERLLRHSWTDYLPYLTGTFQPFFQDPSSLTVPTLGWQATFVLTVPFYDGGLRYGQRQERAALSAGGAGQPGRGAAAGALGRAGGDRVGAAG